MTDKSYLSWGIIATGNIASKFADALQVTDTGKLVAVASRNEQKANDFAAKYGVEKAYASYEELLSDAEVEAVYIATPHPMHAEWAIKAAEAGKHVLCEKPLTLNTAQSMAVIDATERADVFLMEGFMYRCHPQTEKLVELLRSGVIGDVRMIKASFGFDQGANREGRHQANALGGGGILDVGCYPISFCRLVAGVAQGKEFAEPLKVRGVGHLDEETGTDMWASATLLFPGDIIGMVSAGIRLRDDNNAIITGEKGRITLNSPWFCKGPLTVEYFDGRESESFEFDHGTHLYSHEINTFYNAVVKGNPVYPGMSTLDTLGNMSALDAWRKELNFLYEQEKESFNIPPVHGRSLKWEPSTTMRYLKMEGISHPVSQFVLGHMHASGFSHSCAMFDAYYEAGGNTFDSAFIYGGGACDKTVGRWVENRGIRKDVVIIGKGCHTPHCNPVAFKDQFEISLERLRTDYMDIYLFHRDNLDLPVGELVDAVNEEIAKGRIHVWGGSNWTAARIDEATEYALKNGLVPPTALSNNFSLAEMVDPVWAGCIAASDPGFRSWLEARGLANFGWSSQARGFFTERSAPQKREDEELVRCWYSEANFKRKERACELADEKGVSPINIAGAYVLGQRFPSFALIGPATLAELRSSLSSAEIELTPEEMAWLNLESDSRG